MYHKQQCGPHTAQSLFYSNNILIPPYCRHLHGIGCIMGAFMYHNVNHILHIPHILHILHIPHTAKNFYMIFYMILAA